LETLKFPLILPRNFGILFQLKAVVFILGTEQIYLIVIEGHLLYRYYHHLSKLLSKISRNYYKDYNLSRAYCNWFTGFKIKMHTVTRFNCKAK